MQSVMKLKLWWDYLHQKLQYSRFLTLQKCDAGRVSQGEELFEFLKTVFKGKMTYWYHGNCLEMAPTISAQDALLVRSLPCSNEVLRKHRRQINVGDIVVLKDPLDSDKNIIRRVAAVKGYEMVSSKEEDKPFDIEDGQCWVLSDNQNLKPQERKDSLTYGPLPMSDIVGRVIYRFQNTKDHGLVGNNRLSLLADLSVLHAEVDSPESQLLFEDSHTDEENKGSKK